MSATKAKSWDKSEHERAEIVALDGLRRQREQLERIADNVAKAIPKQAPTKDELRRRMIRDARHHSTLRADILKLYEQERRTRWQLAQIDGAASGNDTVSRPPANVVIHYGREDGDGPYQGDPPEAKPTRGESL